MADARTGLEALGEALDGVHFDTRARELAAEWDATVEAAYTLGHGPLPAQSEVIGAVNRISEPTDSESAPIDAKPWFWTSTTVSFTPSCTAVTSSWASIR